MIRSWMYAVESLREDIASSSSGTIRKNRYLENKLEMKYILITLVQKALIIASTDDTVSGRLSKSQTLIPQRCSKRSDESTYLKIA